MLGVIVNAVAVIIGGTVGSFLKKGLPEKITSAIMIAIGLCVMYIGISGSLNGGNTLVLIVSMVFGTAIGSLIDIDDKLNKLGNWAEKKLNRGDGKIKIAEGFITGSLLFCVGSMTVVGSLNAGMLHDNEMLYIKSLLDFISSTMLAATFGIGVALSSVLIFVLQGSMVLLAQQLSGFLTDSAIAQMTCVGSVIIVALSLNMIGLSKFKVANFMPAIILAPIFNWLISLLPFSI
ncbi:MAG: DUF554 domain-containing protein [Ruminococcus sp.]|nr:DUF554 domain-containing protein [Candidatus Copronaster equi]